MTNSGQTLFPARIGLQKLTLLDFPGRMAATVFIPGCNFRCPFCHNAELVLPEKTENGAFLSPDEVLDFLRKRQGTLEGVCFTGGEPLMNAGTPNLLREVKKLGYAVKLDTNGSFPERLKQVVNEGLADYVAMDIKNSPEKYEQTIGVAGKLDAVKESVSFLLNCGIEYEFRTTVVKEYHTEEDLHRIAEWIAGAKHYALQQFVDSGHLLKTGGMSAVEKEELRRLGKESGRILPDVIVRGI